MKKIVAFLLLACLAVPCSAAASENEVLEAVRSAEARLKARVGVAIYDTASGENWLYQADDRFPMASTFKVLACAALLAKTDAGTESLDRKVKVARSDLVTYAPVTEKLVGQEASLGTLCAATMRTSDNTAANIVLDALGGPEAVTAFMRSIGDDVTKLDRREPDLNEARPGDLRDTTSPAAMATSLRRLVEGTALSPASRDQLIEWLAGNEVGGPLLRAGIPQDWRIGDRTGAGGYGTRGVVAVIWPPDRAPLFAAIYITGTGSPMEDRNRAIAGIGKALANTVSASE